MGPYGTRDAASVRRRYFALAVAVGLAATLALAVTIGPHSSSAPSAQKAAARTAVARTATTQDVSAATPVPGNPQAKAAAEAALAGNPAAAAPPPQPLDSHATKTPVTRVVAYHGYQIQVPGSWPVYNLATDPSQCVLFNVHAVYLGTPGSAQDCPAAALGHTESLLIQAVSPASAPSSAVVLPSSQAALSQNAALPAAVTAAAAVSDMLQVEVSVAGVLVTAAYGANETKIRTILAGATQTGTASGSSASTTAAVSGPSATQGVLSSGSQLVTGQAAIAQAASAQAAPAQQAAASATAAKLSGMTGSGLGFDTCTVPSAATMTSWLSSPYRVVATYLGGMNWACSYGNFTTAWVSKVAAEGWRFAPLWVGRQAPCTNVPYVAKINLPQANAEGQSEAKSAVAAARAFGFGPGTPVYFDMEGYETGQSACTRAVLNFLGAWTRTLHAAGYVSGVYSSASSGITDLAHQYGNGSYPRPDDIWIADWNSEPVLTDHAVPNGDWANHQRLHQYASPHNEAWGGATVNMDSDAADGLVAGLPAVPVLHGPNEGAAPSELRVAPGRTATVRLTLQGVPNTPATVRWQVAAPKGLAVSPSAGNVDLWSSAVLTVRVTLAPAKSLAAGRYSLPITVTASGKPVADSFVLVSVVPAGKTLPTAHPVLLYAADKTSMSTAVATAQALALPLSDVTGSFAVAWNAAAGGKILVLAVGQPAADGLYFNVCGWANPAKRKAGSTPFYYPGAPQRQSPGRNYFELSDTSSAAGTAQLTTQLTQYALAGTLPEHQTVPTAPTLACLGSPNVPVP
jgi:glycoside hydrolase-like protein